MTELRPYQSEALEAIRLHLAAGKRRLLVALPTGTGKTVIFACLPSALGLPGLYWLPASSLASREFKQRGDSRDGVLRAQGRRRPWCQDGGS